MSAPDYLSSPLRMAMLLAAVGKKVESEAMMQRHKREMVARLNRRLAEIKPDDPDDAA